MSAACSNSQPDNSQPDNSQPDNNQPDHSQPDNSQPDHSQPDHSQPDNSQPENIRQSRVTLQQCTAQRETNVRRKGGTTLRATDGVVLIALTRRAVAALRHVGTAENLAGDRPAHTAESTPTAARRRAPRHSINVRLASVAWLDVRV